MIPPLFQLFRKQRPTTPLVRSNVFAAHQILCKPEYEKHLFFSGKSRPIMITCETVNICNNDCIICAYGQQKRKQSIMSMEVFDKVLTDYSAMGGGIISLTPMVGDIFLDKNLLERIKRIEQYPNLTKISVTTNATLADRFREDDLRFILDRVHRMHISIYGLDQQEHALLTRRDDHDRALDSIRLMLRVCQQPEKVAFGFRSLRKYTPEQYQAWMIKTFGHEVAYTQISSYSNWGGLFDSRQPLPMQAEWNHSKHNTEQCLIPLVALQVFVNGDVSFCPCSDYDGVKDLSLGNIMEKPLLDLYNSDRCRALWDFEVGANMPRFCRNCSFHQPLKSLAFAEYIFDDPIRFIGG